MFAEEFKNHKVLQWALGALIFNYFIIFYSWIGSQVITETARQTYRYSCPPYWQNCDIFYVFQALPQGYSQSFFYMLLFGVLAWAVYLMSQQKWRETQLVLMIPFVWHFLSLFVLASIDTSGNYEFYVVAFGIVLLFLPHKLFFLKLSLVLYYALSTVVKIHPAWIEGAYFTNLRLGLPLFPDWSIPLFSNLVVLMEMVGSWLLMSRNRMLQRSALVFFVIFHLYSGILVEYRYPATVLLMLLIVFGPWYKFSPVPLDRKSLIGWILFAAIVFMQFIPKFIVGDEKLTLEGGKFGIYMFESNHQCISEAAVSFKDGRQTEIVEASYWSRHRCTPYIYWLLLKARCEDYAGVDKIAWTFDHSINGGPFLRIVDEPNICNLEYKPFSHNTWIKTELDNPAVMGWPVKNYYGGR